VGASRSLGISDGSLRSDAPHRLRQPTTDLRLGEAPDLLRDRRLKPIHEKNQKKLGKGETFR
jgi:hypothetical protein